MYVLERVHGVVVEDISWCVGKLVLPAGASVVDVDAERVFENVEHLGEGERQEDTSGEVDDFNAIDEKGFVSRLHLCRC